MKKAPSTYKIPAQTSESGKAVAEGTLHLNTETNELTIVLGRAFNDQNPASFTAETSKKKAGWKYTGVKTEAAAGTAAPTSQQ
jgi:hypothetical protein